MSSPSLLDRYSQNHLIGMGRILSNDPEPPVLWTGRTEAMEYQPIVAALLDTDHPTLRDFRDGLAPFAPYFGLFVAGIGYHDHVTLLQGKLGKPGLHVLPALEQFFAKNLDLLPTITFDWMGLDQATNVLMTSTVIMPAIASIRGKVEEIMREHEVEPSPLPIVHSTKCRFTAFDADVRTSASLRRNFVEFIEGWQQRVMRERPTITVKSIRCTSVFGLLGQPD